MFKVSFFFLLYQNQSCRRKSAHVLICNYVSENDNVEKKKMLCRRKCIWSISLKHDATKNKFYYILQNSELEMLFKMNYIRHLLGIKECFSKPCCCERAGVMKVSELSWAAPCDSCLTNCNLIIRVNSPGNEMQQQIN